MLLRGMTEPTSVTSKALLPMLILLQSVCSLLQEILATHHTLREMNVATDSKEA